MARVRRAPAPGPGVERTPAARRRGGRPGPGGGARGTAPREAARRCWRPSGPALLLLPAHLPGLPALLLLPAHLPPGLALVLAPDPLVLAGHVLVAGRADPPQAREGDRT